MKKDSARLRRAGAVAENGTRRSAVGRHPKPRLNYLDLFADVERLDYTSSVGARMLKKFHDSLS